MSVVSAEKDAYRAGFERFAQILTGGEAEGEGFHRISNKAIWLSRAPTIGSRSGWLNRPGSAL